MAHAKKLKHIIVEVIDFCFKDSQGKHIAITKSGVTWCKKICQHIRFIMMNYFCGMFDQRKATSLISSRDHCQIFSPSQISDTSQEGFELAHNLISGFFE